MAAPDENAAKELGGSIRRAGRTSLRAASASRVPVSPTWCSACAARLASSRRTSCMPDYQTAISLVAVGEVASHRAGLLRGRASAGRQLLPSQRRAGPHPAVDLYPHRQPEPAGSSSSTSLRSRTPSNGQAAA